MHDADVGLVRNQPVDVGLGFAGLGQHRTGGVFEYANGQLENSLAVHGQQRTARHLAAGDMPGNAQNIDMFAIGVKVCGPNTGLIRGLQHHRAGTVAKQDAGGTV